jgi:hypothetical protein
MHRAAPCRVSGKEHGLSKREPDLLRKLKLSKLIGIKGSIKKN